MEHTTTLADAKAHLSQLAEQAAAGKEIVITKHGRPFARLTRVSKPLQPLNLERIAAFREQLPTSSVDAGDFIRALREDARF